MKQDATYFVIEADDDGDFYFSKGTKDSLLKRLSLDESGYVDLDALSVLETIPTATLMKYWPSGFVLIIKGEIVTPKPVEIVTKFEV